MKNYLLLAGTVLMTGVSCAQNSRKVEVPQTAQTSFHLAHPNAEEIKWEKEGESFEVNFEENEVEMSVLLDAEGSILETESEISTSELPTKAKDYLASNFPGEKVKEAAKIIDQDGTIKFEAEIGGLDIFFDQDGNFLK
jgi:hypothetical protein